MYLAAQSAARHHAGLREFYRGLRARGKPDKVALTAVMRKLITQLNAIAVRGTPWSPPPAHILPCPSENRLTPNTDTPLVDAGYRQIIPRQRRPRKRAPAQSGHPHQPPDA